MSTNRLQSPVDLEVVDHSVSDHDIVGSSNCLWVSVSGDVAITTLANNDVTIPNVPVGWLEVRAKAVLNTGTTATVSHAGLFQV